MIPNMDKEVAKAIIEQFPAYVDFSVEMIRQLNESCEAILSSNDVSQKQIIESYMLTLESLYKLLEKENLTMEEMEYITEKMIDITDKIAAKDTENKELIKYIYDQTGKIIMGIVVVGLAILGVNVKLGMNRS